MALKCSTDLILDSNEYTAPNLVGEDAEFVQYVYRTETPLTLPVGCEITPTTYTTILENGQKQTIIHSMTRFYQIGDDWYELYYDAVTKAEWDEAQ